MSLTADISNISRGSLHDGDGVRTVVYFKGCGLRCRWCHNPETFSRKKEVMYNPDKCICCGKCIEICPQHHRPGETHALFIRDECDLCIESAKNCPTGALSVCGEEKTVEELFQEISKDFHYYQQSGGGVTLSGGECLLQADFAREFLKKCKETKIHTAIETALFVPYEEVEKVLPYTDLVFADLKIAQSDRHEEFTGHGNELIIENMKKLIKDHRRVIIRIPLIPGVNDSNEDMNQFGKIINTFAEAPAGIELLRYNYLAESKYRLLDREYTSFGEDKQSDEKMEDLKKSLQKEIKSNIIIYYI